MQSLILFLKRFNQDGHNLHLGWVNVQYNNNNNNNFILCMQELDSLPPQIAGKLVVAGQD